MLHEIIFFVIIVIVCVSNSYGYKHLPTISLSKRISSTKSISSLAAFTATEATYTLGAPSSKPNNGQFVTTGELVVSYNVEEVVDYQSRIDKLRDDLDNNKGNRYQHYLLIAVHIDSVFL